jgi:ribonuclease BN (tRNA processing enzyme)
VQVTVLGACGAWPEPDNACSGFLIEHEGYRLLLDAGYATLPRLLTMLDAADLDAVYITHGHPDHCADLNPLLRARALRDDPPPSLPIYALPGALDAVLALDHPRMIGQSYELHPVSDNHALTIGPFDAHTALLPHSVPNAGIRLTAGGRTIAYTCDAAPSDRTVDLARNADLFIAEATHLANESPNPTLSTAEQAGAQARAAGVHQLLLTHLWPGTNHADATAAARTNYGGPTDVATRGQQLTL